MKDRLEAIIDKAIAEADDNFGMPNSTQMTEIMLGEGVLAPPVKIGQKIWYITGIHGWIVAEGEIVEIYWNGDAFAIRVCGENGTYFDMQDGEYYVSKEEAEKHKAKPPF